MNVSLHMLRNNIIISFVFLAFLMSCNNISQTADQQSTVPIIPKEKMIVILADVQITEAYIDDLRKSGHPTKDSSILYFEKVFKKHDITPNDFEQSLLFYKGDLEGMDEMYKKVVTRLNELKAKSEEILIKMKEDSIKQDSLNKIRGLTDSINNLNDTIFVTDSLKHQTDTNNILP